MHTPSGSAWKLPAAIRVLNPLQTRAFRNANLRETYLGGEHE